MKYIISKIEKEINNLCSYLIATLPYNNYSNNCNSESKERLVQFDKYVTDIQEVMTCKAEKINAIRRNSLAFNQK